MSLSMWTELMQRLKENIQLFITHINNTTHKYRSIFLRDLRDGVMYIISKGIIDI